MATTAWTDGIFVGMYVGKYKTTSLIYALVIGNDPFIRLRIYYFASVFYGLCDWNGIAYCVGYAKS